MHAANSDASGTRTLFDQDRLGSHTSRPNGRADPGDSRTHDEHVTSHVVRAIDPPLVIDWPSRADPSPPQPDLEGLQNTLHFVVLEQAVGVRKAGVEPSSGPMEEDPQPRRQGNLRHVKAAVDWGAHETRRYLSAIRQE